MWTETKTTIYSIYHWYNAICQFTEQAKRTIAETVGIGAIKYADLSHNRTSNYIFDMDKMVRLEGNTSAYVQYSYARAQSILRRAVAQDWTPDRWESAPMRLAENIEMALGLQLSRLLQALTRPSAHAVEREREDSAIKHKAEAGLLRPTGSRVSNRYGNGSRNW